MGKKNTSFMKEYTLSLAEVLALDIELNGQYNQETNTQVVVGLLHQSLSLVAKYWITKLAKTVADEKAKVENFKNDLIKKYGTEDEKGAMNIPVYMDESRTAINPAFIEFNNEFNTLLREQVTLQYTPIKLSWLEAIQTNETYGVLYGFVDDAA